MASSDDPTPTPRPDDLLDKGLRSAFLGRTSQTPPAALDLVKDRYRLLRVIAQGGMGVVFRAHDTDLEREVAVKVLRTKGSDDALAGIRFVEESQIAGQLQHPGIVPVYDSGETPDGRPFYVMKVVEGETLAARLRGDHSLSENLAVVESVAQAMAYAHARGVIHRDLKPANIMVGPFGEVLVMDWGLARSLDGPTTPDPAIRSVRSKEASSISQTQTGSVLGTPAYMPPEQARGDLRAVDRRADVFSLGAILLEVLTGRRPYEGTDDSLEAARHGKLEGALEALSAVDLPREPADLAARCLHPDPEERPADAGEVAHILANHRLAQEKRTRAAEFAVAAARQEALAQRRLRKRNLIAAVGVVAGLAIAAVTWWGVESQRRERAWQSAHALEAALGSASQRLEDARAEAGPRGDLHLQEAAAALENARATIIQSDADSPMRDRLSVIDSAIGDERRRRIRVREQAEVDAAMVTRLQDIRLARGLHSSSQIERSAYEEAFAEYGVKKDIPSSTRLIVESAIRSVLVDGLHDWIGAYSPTAVRHLQGKPLILRQIADAADPDPMGKRIRAACFDGDADALRAVASTDEILRAAPGTLMLLAEAVHRDEGVESYLAFLRRARAAHPGDFRINLHLADILLERSPADALEGLRYVTAAEAVLPDSFIVQLTLARGFVRCDRGAEALALIARVEERAPDYALTHYVKGVILTDLKRLDDAEAAWKRALELHKDPSTWHNLAMISVRRNDIVEARARLRSALESDPDYAPALSALGHYEILDGRKAEGMSMLERAVEADPNLSAAWNGLVQGRYRSGDIEGADEAARRGLARVPDDFYLHAVLALTLRARGRAAEAVPLLVRAVELAKPQHRASAEEDLRKCREEVEVIARARALVEGELPPPEDEREWLRILGHCEAPRLFALEASVWSRCRASSPSVIQHLPAQRRFRPVLAAIQAGLGLGHDAKETDEATRAACLADARQGLADDWSQLEEAFAAGQLPERRLASLATRALEDPLLDKLRAIPLPAGATDEERNRWDKTWARIQSRADG